MIGEFRPVEGRGSLNFLFADDPPEGESDVSHKASRALSEMPTTTIAGPRRCVAGFAWVLNTLTGGRFL